MKAFKRDGVAIVFVSHNMQAVGELCDEAVVVKGTPRFRGSVGQAVQCYLALSNDGQQTGRGDDVSASAVRLTDAHGAEVDAVPPHTPLQLHADIYLGRDFRELIFGVIVRRSTDAMQVFDAAYTAEELGFDRIAAGQTVRLRYDHVLHLARGQYTYEVNVYDVAESRHRLVVPAGGVRVDEYRTHSAIADLAGTMTATPV
jgi:energy-coupling factor transporter ATP-binding protein EcfA2